jgi:hypothetical protein
MPSYLRLVKYDGVILHYTLLSVRWNRPSWTYFLKGLAPLKRMQTAKVAIPQDENAETESLCHLFLEANIQTVFTCADPIDYQTLYPREKTGLKHYFTAYTGFVDEETLKLIQQLSRQMTTRDIDIGYRARSIPYWLGEFGQYKGRIATAFNKFKEKTPLKMDISTHPQDVFYGDDWFRFMLRCRVMPSCLGGASLFDADGTIREQVESYTKAHPQATFEEVAQKFFPDKDHSLHLFALSPRHFECAMTKTCQILVEGDWKIFEPGRDYIELKKDFSNIEEVLRLIEDKEYCQQIAENAYETIVKSGKYTYANFARQVINHIREVSRESGLDTDTLINKGCFHLVGYFLSLRRKCDRVHFLIYRVFLFCVIGIPRRLAKLWNYFKTRTASF